MQKVSIKVVAENKVDNRVNNTGRPVNVKSARQVRLNKQAETKQRVLAGSRTDENKAVREESNLLGSLAQASASMDLVSLLRAGTNVVLSRAKGISSESSEALQKRLFSVDPVEQTAILQELNRRARKPQTGLLSGAAAVGSATGILGDK